MPSEAKPLSWLSGELEGVFAPCGPRWLVRPQPGHLAWQGPPPGGTRAVKGREQPAQRTLRRPGGAASRVGNAVELPNGLGEVEPRGKAGAEAPRAGGVGDATPSAKAFSKLFFTPQSGQSKRNVRCPGTVPTSIRELQPPQRTCTFPSPPPQAPASNAAPAWA